MGSCHAGGSSWKDGQETRGAWRLGRRVRSRQPGSPAGVSGPRPPAACRPSYCAVLWPVLWRPQGAVCPRLSAAGGGGGREEPAPQGPARRSDRPVPQQNRQMKHISAEQKRRFNIKMSFDTLNSLISNNSKLVSGGGRGPADPGGRAGPAGRHPDRPPPADQPRGHAAEDHGAHRQAAAGAQPDAGGGAAAARGDRGAQRHHPVSPRPLPRAPRTPHTPAAVPTAPSRPIGPLGSEWALAAPGFP